MQITRKFEWPMGHRLMNHEGGCKYCHGHNWIAEVTIVSPDLDAVGRVIDFSALKKLVLGWIDEHWDHAFVVNGSDKEFTASIKEWSKLYILPENTNPTSENLSKHLHDKIAEILPKPLSVKQVVLQETSNCWSTYPERTPQFT